MGGRSLLAAGARHVAVRHRPGLHCPPRGRRGVLCTWCFPEATGPVRRFLPQTSPTPSGRGREDPAPPHLEGEGTPAWYLRAGLSRAVQGSGGRNKSLFLSWVGVSLTLRTLLSLGPLSLPFPSRGDAHLGAVQPRPLPAVRCTHTCIQMSRACCTSEALLLLLSVGGLRPKLHHRRDDRASWWELWPSVSPRVILTRRPRVLHGGVCQA